jgi:glycosyltransferase 2 family protein
MGDAIVATSGELRQKSFWWWLRAFFGTALSWISRYMVVNAILLAFAINADQVMVLARQLVMWVVLTICPTPGGSGVSEWIFKNYYGDMIASGSLALLLALCWRIISYYIYLIIGICVIPSWLRQWKRKRQKAKSNGINGQETMQHPR